MGTFTVFIGINKIEMAGLTLSVKLFMVRKEKFCRFRKKEVFCNEKDKKVYFRGNGGSNGIYG